MQELHDILSILKNPGNPVDSFTLPSFSGPILLSTKSVSIRHIERRPDTFTKAKNGQD